MPRLKLAAQIGCCKSLLLEHRNPKAQRIANGELRLTQPCPETGRCLRNVQLQNGKICLKGSTLSFRQRQVRALTRRDMFLVYGSGQQLCLYSHGVAVSTNHDTSSTNICHSCFGRAGSEAPSPQES